MKLKLTPKSQRLAATLLTTLFICAIMTASIMGYLSLVETQNRLSMRSQTWNLSLSIAEAGIEEGLQHLNANHSNLSADGWTFSGTNYYCERNLSIGGYKVSITPGGMPVIVSEAKVKVGQFTWADRLFFAAVGVTPSDGTVSRTVRVSAYRGKLFDRAIAAEDGVDMNGNNVLVDSFSSCTDGPYSPSIAGSEGDVSSNGTFTNSVNVGNAEIYGHVATGPGGTIYVGSQGKIGDQDWLAANPGYKIQPGWTSDDSNFMFPDSNLPKDYQTYASPLPGTNGWDYIIPAGGKYKMSSSLSGKKLLILAPNVTLVHPMDLKLAEQAITLADGATVTVYAGGTSASLKLDSDELKRSVVNKGSKLASEFILYLADTVKNFDVSGNGTFTGVLVAPSTHVDLNGGGSDGIDWIGSLLVKSIKLNGHFKVHYDICLKNLPPTGKFMANDWREIY